MTIALGVLASDGLVVAADTQETIGYVKADAGKVALASHRFLVEGSDPPAHSAATCLVTGAGYSSHVDVLSKHLRARFQAQPHIQSLEHIPGELAPIVREFFLRQIHPWAAYPREDRPDARLLFGALFRGQHHGLFAIEDGLVVEASLYAAVGIGAPHARAMLGRFYQLPIPTVWESIPLVAYVMHQVKETIDGCGKGTDIMFVRHDKPQSGLLTRNETAELEQIASDFSFNVEPAHLRQLIGAPKPTRAMAAGKVQRNMKRAMQRIIQRRTRA